MIEDRKDVMWCGMDSPNIMLYPERMFNLCRDVSEFCYSLPPDLDRDCDSYCIGDVLHDNNSPAPFYDWKNDRPNMY